jgi:hypothetical protein
MEAKFRWLVRDLVGDDATERLIDMCWHVDELNDVRELTSVVREVLVRNEAAQTQPQG